MGINDAYILNFVYHVYRKPKTGITIVEFCSLESAEYSKINRRISSWLKDLNYRKKPLIRVEKQGRVNRYFANIEGLTCAQAKKLAKKVLGL